jgi:hypothetical protein
MGRKHKNNSKKKQYDDDDDHKSSTNSPEGIMGASSSTEASESQGGAKLHVLVMDQSGARLDAFIANQLGFSRSRGLVLPLPYLIDIITHFKNNQHTHI